MNESLVKYLAGLLDADGSLSLNFKADHNRAGRHFVTLRLSLAASDAVDRGGFVESLPELTGMGGATRYGARGQFVNWNVTKRAHVEMLAPRLTKHMVVKARHWDWMLGVWRELRSERKSFTLAERDALAAASRESRRLNVGPLKPKNHPTWAWVAGYLDGDGCYTYRKNRAHTGHEQWTMNVSAVAHVTDQVVLEFLQAAFGGRIEERPHQPNVRQWKRALGYQNRAFALRFLPRVARHARLKRDRIDAMIHHHRQRLSVPGTPKAFCEVNGCGKPSKGHGLCSLHYQRRRRSIGVQATV